MIDRRSLILGFALLPLSLSRAATASPEPAVTGFFSGDQEMLRVLALNGVDPPLASRLLAFYTLLQHDLYAAARQRARNEFDRWAPQLPLALCGGQLPAGMTFDEAGGLPARSHDTVDQRVVASVSQLLSRRRQDGARFDQISTCRPGGAIVWASPFNRPPVRPGWGRIPPLLMGSAATAEPPPLVSSPAVHSQLETIERLTNDASPQDRDFVRRYGYPTGTITPAGYWLEQASRVGAQHQLKPVERLFLRALVMSAVHDATICCWQLKYRYWYPRPSQLNSAIRPIISVPNFPSYTSGHASMSGAASRIIAALVPAAAAAVIADAEAAAYSRVLGGIHFEFDTSVGITQGRQVADAVLESCRAVGPGSVLCELIRSSPVDDQWVGDSQDDCPHAAA